MNLSTPKILCTLKGAVSRFLPCLKTRGYHALNFCVELNLDDFETIRSRVPVLCDLKPSGRYVTTDLHQAGGIPQVMKMLLVRGLLHGDCITITGKTIAEILAEVNISDAELASRRAKWQPRSPVYIKGILAKYAKLVSSSSVGAVTDL